MITVKDLDDFKRLRILVVGDAMVDRYEFCEPVKLSQEAAVPILRPVQSDQRLGGAANLLANISALDVSSVSIVTAFAGDRYGTWLHREISKKGKGETAGFLMVEDTTIKQRVYAGSQQVCRIDLDVRHVNEEKSAEAVRDVLNAGHWDVIAVSDYGKGVVNQKSLAAIRESKVPWCVEGKRGFDRYLGATFIKGSQQDLVGQALANDNLESLMRHLSMGAAPSSIFLTLGAEGIAWAQNGDTARYATREVDVRDATGAGDVAMAALVCAWAAGWTPEKAARLANISAGISVGRVGTTVVTRDDIAAQIYDHRSAPPRPGRKVLQPGAIQQTIESWRSEGHRIGIVNGRFDLLHAGHLALLTAARAECDRLLVLVNDDDSYRQLRGHDPAVDHSHRALLVAGLACVDAVAVFALDSPAEIIRELKPDVYMYGWDHSVDDPEVKAAHEVGAAVGSCPRYEEYSSTSIREKIRA